MFLRTETLSEKKLTGKRRLTTLTENITPELWKSFMPRRKEIINNVDNNLISMQVYKGALSLENFDPHAVFEKWAAVEVHDFNHTPVKMDTFIIPAGLYAVFYIRGHRRHSRIHFNTFLVSGYLHQRLRPTTAHILKFLAKSTKTMSPIRKKKCGYLLSRKINFI